MYVQWSGLFEIGVPGGVDAEHRHLVGIVNAFHGVVSAGEARGKVLYVEVHFLHEDRRIGEYSRGREVPPGWQEPRPAAV